MRRLAITLLVLAACNSGVRGLGDDRAPLATIHGRFDHEFVLNAKNPRAAIIWAGVPVFVPYCHEFGPTPVDKDRKVPDVAANGCRDPYEVVPGLYGPNVPFDIERRDFEITLDHLPQAVAMVGSLDARVAYGSLVVFDDEDGDGVFDFGSRCARRDRGDDAVPQPEKILAASFTKLNAKQTRITYVEGAFDADSFYYPHPNCAELPPPGFSIWTVGDLLEPSSTCSVAPSDQLIELQPLNELFSDRSHLQCWPSERESFSRPPPENGTGTNVLFECTSDGKLVVSDQVCPCPNLRTYALRGCYSDAGCATPDWDLEPPEGWPCQPQP